MYQNVPESTQLPGCPSGSKDVLDGDEHELVMRVTCCRCSGLHGPAHHR